MCNEPLSNIDLKPLGILFRPYGKPTSSVLSLFGEKAKKSIYKAYCIKLEPVFCE